jgi:hypothetical protein
MYEIWKDIEHSENAHKWTYIKFSNAGRLMKKSGEIVDSRYRQLININGDQIKLHRAIADAFLITVHRPDQNCIDHITHNPVGMNINDVRNLRYCTHAENLRFPEARENNSKSKIGKKLTEEHRLKLVGHEPANKNKNPTAKQLAQRIRFKRWKERHRCQNA